MTKTSYKQREQARKRSAAIKANLLAKANEAIERLWSACNQSDSGFPPGERKAIADASYAIRSIHGGWVRRR